MSHQVDLSIEDVNQVHRVYSLLSNIAFHNWYYREFFSLNFLPIDPRQAQDDVDEMRLVFKSILAQASAEGWRSPKED